MEKIVEFKKRKPSDISLYIDFDKGWKFTEDNKEFLLKYYEEYLQLCVKEFDGDFADEVSDILESIKNNGVAKSKELIQEDAMMAASAFGYDIYQKYSDSPDILKLIENSILNVQW